MGTLCGLDCTGCSMSDKCKGCEATCGSPFGGRCVAAEQIKFGGMELYQHYKNQLINEINELKIVGLPEIKELFCLNGAYVNLAYPLPSGENIKFLKDEDIYLGTQVESQYAKGRCFGIVAGENFLLVVEYGENGTNPELIMYKKRTSTE